MRAGQVYKKFIRHGKQVILRAAKWEDLDDMLELANQLVQEHEVDPDFGVLLSKRLTRNEEADWLAKKLVRIEQGKEVSVIAEVHGRLVGTSEVVRGDLEDVSAHGTLGIAISRDYRGIGMGKEMIKCLIKQSKAAGWKTVQLGVLSTNPRAIAVYEGAGFKRAGVLKGKVRRGRRVIDEIIMTRDLS